MALTATICKAVVDISDLRRHYYQQHRLTLARHPSETDQRMMLRLLAFVLFADERLQFTRGLSNDDEPDLWLTNAAGEVELWIELGHPTEKRLRRARSQSQRTIVLCYGDRATTVWWAQTSKDLRKLGNLTVLGVSDEHVHSLGTLATRSMQLQFTVDDNSVWISDSASNLQLDLLLLHGSAEP